MEDERLDRPVGASWDDVIDQQAALAEDYRDAGWTVVELHPGDVTIREPDDHDRFGFDVVVPGREFDALQETLHDGVDLDGYELLGDVEGPRAVVLVVIEASDAEVVVLYPLYYATHAADDVREAALDDGMLYTIVRPLDRHAEVVFTHDDPALFFGEGAD